MKVLVTGATGLIGARVVRRLLDQRHAVRCLVRSDRRRARLAGLPIEQVRGDLFDAASLRAAASGCDGCIHLAGISGWDHIAGPDVHAVIHGGTLRLLDALTQTRVGRLVYVSSTAAVDGTLSPITLDEGSAFSLADSGLAYAVAKHAAERMVRERSAADLRTVVVNPAETYGTEDEDWITAGSIRDILRGWPAMAVRGGTSVVHVDDVAQGVVAALDRGRPGERYILGGQNVTISELVRLTLALAGLRRPVVTVPFGVLNAAVGACRLVGAKPPVEPALMGYLRRYWYVDSRKAGIELGFAPRDARATLAPVVRWVRDQAPAQPPRRVPVQVSESTAR